MYGGSSSVGTTAIQLAKAAGATVVTTASKHSHEYCKELGADKVFDYKDSDWVERAATFIRGRQIAGAFDSISTENTAGASAEVLARAGSKSLTMTVSPISESVKSKFGQFISGANMTLNGDLARAIWSDFLPLALEKGSLYQSQTL